MRKAAKIVLAIALFAVPLMGLDSCVHKMLVESAEPGPGPDGPDGPGPGPDGPGQTDSLDVDFDMDTDGGISPLEPGENRDVS